MIMSTCAGPFLYNCLHYDLLSTSLVSREKISYHVEAPSECSTVTGWYILDNILLLYYMDIKMLIIHVKSYREVGFHQNVSNFN